jgi:hypothetical protein
MTDLTLPGTIPGLLRRGSPVTQGARSGVVVHLWEVDGMASVAWAPPDDTATDCCWSVDRLALDLTDATGRAHAAWWLAGRHGLNPSHGVSSRLVGHAGSPMLVLLTMEVRGCGPESVTWAIDRDACPSLADLDPADPRLLPDGSRWGDAEALRRVVRLVAGVSRA